MLPTILVEEKSADSVACAKHFDPVRVVRDAFFPV
jgi:hypothetical protein